MADSEHFSSVENYLDSQEEKSGEQSLEFSEDEVELIIRMYNLVGERWSLIAGRIPGRSAEEVGRYWNSRYSTKERSKQPKLEFSEAEEDLVIKMYNLVGKRWSLIAGRIPGRTAEEIEKYWNSRCSTN